MIGGKNMKRRAFLCSMVTLATGTAATLVTGQAIARVGRPASPVSVSGVRRRTRRRTRRRIVRHQQLTALPYGCGATRIRGGVSYYYCGGIWYRPAYQGTTVVYIVEEIEEGANTEVEFEG